MKCRGQAVRTDGLYFSSEVKVGERGPLSQGSDPAAAAASCCNLFPAEEA